jgi:hypothetical protein
MLHTMTAQFNGDPAATDSTRVLRLPGFANKKYEQDFLVKVHSKTGQTYHQHDFKLRTEPVDAGPARWNQSQDRHAASTTRRDRLGSTEPHELSQSERDWAYAKRALSRGESPKDIMRNIAEFRAYDKPNPQDYAFRTVTKALAELGGLPSPHSPDSAPAGDSNQEHGR